MKPEKKTTPPENKLKHAIVVVVTVLALGYLLLRPVANQFGWNLPGFGDDPKEVAENNDSETGVKKTDAKNDSSTEQPSDQKKKNPANSPNTKKPDNGKSTSAQTGNKGTSQNDRNKSNPTRGPPVENKSSTAELGVLTETSKDVYQSTAGLIYTPGSRDGHRIDHVMKHAKDDLSKPVHGVFEGSKEEIFALIDSAYLLIQKNDRKVSSSKSGNRMAYTIYFGKRIGYVGGQAGKRKRHPMAKDLSLILEGNKVITAYPK